MANRIVGVPFEPDVRKVPGHPEIEGTVKTLGSPALCVESGGKEDATAEQIKVCASIHLTLYHLQLVDLSLGLTAAPGHGERRLDGRFFLPQTGREGLHSPDTA